MLNVISAKETIDARSESSPRASRTRAREGGFVETIDGLFFDVKGLVHPPDNGCMLSILP